VLARLARFSYQRRRFVVLAWIGLLIVAVAAGVLLALWLGVGAGL